MEPYSYSVLEDRGILLISGGDARQFLQGLISNDVTLVTGSNTIYAALLTPQGKYLFDFFIAEHADGLLLETERARMADLIKRLSTYKLRADVHLQDISDGWYVVAAWGNSAFSVFSLGSEAGATAAGFSGIAFVDPRLAIAGARILLPKDNSLPKTGRVPTEAYDIHRLALGLPNSSRDLTLDKATLLENGFDELHGIDWNKGCYIGQELTARTKYRGLVKKRLMPVDITGQLPEPGTPILSGNKTVGEIRSGRNHRALALIRLDAINDENQILRAGSAIVIPQKPAWAKF